MLGPNQGPMPSYIGNDPVLSALIGTGGAPLVLGDVNEESALTAPDRSTNLTPQGPVNNLMSLRAQFPFLPILPLPTAYESVHLAANTAEDIAIPSGASLMLLRGNADYYVATNGNAEVPSATNTAGNAGSNRAKSFYAPQGILLYVSGVNSISVISPDADTIVTACFWSPDQMPR
jgi:hypothetical protein